MFEIVRRGYNQKQVGDFVVKTNKIIIDLKNKNADLDNQIINLENEINNLKIAHEEKNEVVVRAVQNESNNKILYDLEVSKLNELINKWSDTLDSIRNKFGEISEVELQSLEFKNDLQKQTQKIIDFNFTKKEDVLDEKFYHKQLLNKMSGSYNLGHVDSKNIEIEKHEEEIKKLDENLIKPQIKKEVVNNSFTKPTKDFSSLLNKYLGDIDQTTFDIEVKDEFINDGLAGVPNYYPEPNSSGFNLKEALNPKESLDDIMSGFEFYNPQQNLKKKKKL